MTISKTERGELRSVVRQQYKVLRAEVAQRERELYAEVEHQLRDRYSAEDGTWQAFMHKIHEITMEANRQVNDAIHEFEFEAKGPTERVYFSTPHFQQPKAQEQALRREAVSDIKAKVQAALMRLDRDEADLLRNLSMEAIESEEARSFLGRIPSVGELVPAARLAELEKTVVLDDDEGRGLGRGW